MRLEISDSHSTTRASSNTGIYDLEVSVHRIASPTESASAAQLPRQRARFTESLSEADGGAEHPREGLLRRAGQRDLTLRMNPFITP